MPDYGSISQDKHSGKLVIENQVASIMYHLLIIEHRVSDQILDNGTYHPAVVSDSEHGIG